MKIPPVPNNIQDAAVSEYFRVVVRALDDLQRRSLVTERATASVLLASPNGTVYSVQVDDAGTVTTTKVRDP